MRSRRSPSAPRLVLVAALAAVGLTACGDDRQSVEVSATDALADAAGTTAATSFRITLETTTKAGNDSVVSHGSGARSGDRGTMTVELPNPDYDLSMDVVAADGKQFLRYQGMPDGAPLPTGWIELTGDAGAVAAVTSTVGLDAYLDAFRAKDAKVTDKGTATRGGQEVHRYSTVVDLSKMAAVPDSVKNRFLQTTMKAMAANLKAVPTDIEVDAKGRIVRLTQRTTMAAGSSTTVMTIDHFGETNDIEVPTGAQRLTPDELMDRVYPNPEPSGVEVDPADLVDRDQFVEAMTSSETGISEQVAGCIYDEMRTSSPENLTAEALSEFDDAAKAALQSASMLCAVSPG